MSIKSRSLIPLLVVALILLGAVGVASAGGLVARAIFFQEPEEVEVFGTVEQLTPDFITVASKAIRITPQTEFKEPVVVGDLVKVHAFIDNESGLTAREIELSVGDFANNNGDDDNSNMNGNDNDDNGNTNGNANDDDGNVNGDDDDDNSNMNGDDDNDNGNMNGDDDDNGNMNGDDDNSNGNDNDNDDRGSNRNGNDDDDDDDRGGNSNGNGDDDDDDRGGNSNDNDDD